MMARELRSAACWVTKAAAHVWLCGSGPLDGGLACNGKGSAFENATHGQGNAKTREPHPKRV